MTLHYRDVSSFQQGASLRGQVAVCARATEGNWLTDPAYAGFQAQAERLRLFLFPYHLLESLSSPQEQARFCHSITGGAPVMTDVEGYQDQAGNWVSRPSVSQAVRFTDAYRALGGVNWLVYLPRWYWNDLGAPSLQPFLDRGMSLVSSLYTTYSDTGAGWLPYTWPGGSWAPTVWQYSQNAPLNGFLADADAFKGSGSPDLGTTLAEFKSLVTTGAILPPAPLMAGDETMPMLMNKGTGAVTPVAMPRGTTTMRLLCAGVSAQVKVTFYATPPTTEDLRGIEHGGTSRALAVPKNCHAAELTRLDGGTNDVSVTLG